MVQWIEQRKMSFLKLVPKNIEMWMRQKRNNFLKIIEKNINRWTFHKEKQLLLNKIVEHSRKRHHSTDCKKEEKHLNIKRNQLAINSSTQNRKIFKLHGDVYISQFCHKIKQGPYYVCTVYQRMLYRKSD